MESYERKIYFNTIKEKGKNHYEIEKNKDNEIIDTSIKKSVFSDFMGKIFNRPTSAETFVSSKTYINPKLSLSLMNDERLNNPNKKSTPFTIDEWKTLFTNNSVETIDQNRLLISLKKGIPNEIRGKVWMLLSQSFRTYKEQHKKNIKYSNLLLDKNEQAENLIKRDIHRTMLNNDRTHSFKVDGTKLFNVLKAYSIIDRSISYCQGTNSIVATLLVYIGKEEFCFWTFHNLMQKSQWRLLFLDNTPKLFRMVDMLKNNFKSKMKDLYEHFKKIKFVDYLDIIFTHFFLTVFTYNCPIELSSRVIDLFWLYEESVIINTVINIMFLQKDKMKTMGVEELISYLKKEIVFDAVEKYGVDYIINLS